MTRSASSRAPIEVPLDYPTALIFMDESGSKGSGSNFFVMGAVKLRRPGAFAREVRAIRDRTGFTKEFKFSEITKGALPAYFGLVDALAASDAHLAATVIDKGLHDPFPSRPLWSAQAEILVMLLRGCVNRRELVSVLIDGVSTPQGIAIDDEVRQRVNAYFGACSVVTAACLDSRSNDGLQTADLVAGAIAHERRRQIGESVRPGARPDSPKAQVARRLVTAFGIEDLGDQRSQRVNIVTMRGRRGSADRVATPRGHVRRLEVLPGLDDTSRDAV